MSETSDLSIIFYGKDAEECEEFIRLVRLHAFKKGKKDDDAWIAGQVYPCFGGRALRWYLRQPRDNRDDWELLQQALIQEWPEIRDERSAQPTPAAAPLSAANVLQQPAISKGSNPAAQKTGRILVKVPNNSGVEGYVSKKLSGLDGNPYMTGTFSLMTDLGEGLEVQLCPTDTTNIWRLGVKDLPGVEYLAAYPPNGSNFTATGVIIGVQRAPTGRSGESTTYASTTASYLNHQYHTDVWELGNQGALTFRWPDRTLGNATAVMIVYDSTYLGILNESSTSNIHRKAVRLTTTRGVSCG